MFRITTLFLCAFFLASVAGRYRAEESVQAARAELDRLDTEYAAEERKVQMLRAEIAYLESPDRLAKVARATTELRPPAPQEILTAREFASAMAGEDAQVPAAPGAKPAANAVAVAQLADEE